MDKIDQLLHRGVDKVYPDKKSLERFLRSGKKLKLYQGFDPTGDKLHIGHAVGFRKLRQFQDLGHEVIFLIGDGTGQAGDPSGKKNSRDKFFTNKELRENGKSYILQASKIVRFDGLNPVIILYNSDWLNKLGLVEILDIAGHFTLQQMLERDLYQERLKNKIDLSLREFLYPLLQGYDSVAMQVDLELGGTDQTFNMLTGRQLVKQILHKDKFVMTVPLLTDAKGNKIGKTEGNVIGLTDKPSEFYAKIMSLGDDAIIPCFTLLTDAPLDVIDLMKQKISAGGNPMIFKKKLAFELTKQLNDLQAAQAAQAEFEHVFQKHQAPVLSAIIFRTSKKEWNVIDLLVETAIAHSKSDAKRLIEQKAVEINDKTIDKSNSQAISLSDGDIIKAGKKKFLKICLIPGINMSNCIKNL